MRPQKSTKVTKTISLWFLCFFVAALLLPTDGAACSYIHFLHGLEVHRDFTVHITYAGKPLPGVTVHISSLFGSYQEVFRERTTTDGTVRIRNLRPGKYV